MCGPSSQEQQIAGQEQSFASMLQSNYQQNFANQAQALQNLNNIFTPIAEAGPNQQGYNAQTLAALNTQAGEGVAANYQAAQRAVNAAGAAKGGGNQFLPTGAQASLNQQVGTAAAQQMSQEQLGITEANYAQGRQNWQQATSGLNALAGEYNPNAIAGETNQASSGAFSSANQVQNMKNQEESDIAGGILGLGTGFLTGGLGNLAGSGGGASTGEQIGNFFTGGLQGLGG